jgi:hypothetical protein
MTVSDSRETLKAMLMFVLFTVSSLVVSGTAEVKVHSSSSMAALVLLCAKLDFGAGAGAGLPPRRSTAAGPVECGLIDCWKCIGDA